MKYVCLLAILAALTRPATAQTVTPDNAQIIFQDPSQPDSLRGVAAEELAYQAEVRSDLDSAYFYAHQVLSYGEAAAAPKIIYSGYNAISRVHFTVGNIDSAEIVSERAMKFARDHALERGVAVSSNVLALVAYRRGQLQQADSFLQTTKEIALAIADTSLALIAGTNQAVFLGEAGKYEAALKTNLSLIELAKDDPYRTLQLTMNAGTYCDALKLDQRALDYFRRAEKMASHLDAQREIAIINNNIGGIYNKAELYDSATYAFERALGIEAGDATKVYTHTGLGLANLREHNYEEAKQQYLEAIRLAKSVGFIQELAIAQVGLGDVYQLQRDLLSARKYYSLANELLHETNVPQEKETKIKLFNVLTLLELPIDSTDWLRFQLLQDSLFTAERTAALAEITDRYNVAEARAAEAGTLLALTKEKSFRNYVLIAAAALLGILCLIVWSYRRQRKSNTKLSKAKTRIELLYQELHHRTNNNLNTLATLLSDQIEQGRSVGLPVGALGDFQRQLLAISTVQTLLDVDQTDINLQSYLHKLAQAFEGHAAVEREQFVMNIRCPEIQVSAEFASSLGLILNELVRNSFKYSQRRNGELEVFLDVTVKDNTKVRIDYHDLGPAETVRSVHSTKSGRGLIERLTNQLHGHLLKQNKRFDYSAMFPKHKAIEN